MSEDRTSLVHEQDEWMTDLLRVLGDDCLRRSWDGFMWCVFVSRRQIVDALRNLRDDPIASMDQLVDLCGVDYPDSAERFEVVYHLLSLRHNKRLRVKVSTDAMTPVPSVVCVYPCASWYEREAWDMFGILFQDHVDLRRLLTDYGFDGHPLRKDFPLSGFVETRYDALAQRVVYDPVCLEAADRNYNFESRWKGVADPVFLKKGKRG